MSQSEKQESFYVIAKKAPTELVTTVMHAGPDGDEEAVAVFTEQSMALEYLNQAGWVDTETVADLNPQAFLTWLLKSVESGPKLVVVNPDRVQQEDKIRQTVIPVAELLQRLGPAITECLTATDLAAAN